MGEEATFNNIFWVMETGVPEENHRPCRKSLTNVSHNVVSSTPPHERDSNSQR